MSTPTGSAASPMALWSDDPATSDLLSFDALASTTVDALLDERLDPVALGLSGRWGSGKSTVLALIELELDARQDPNKKILVVKTQPWRYDPTLGAKETLIGEVLGALAVEVESLQTKSDNAKKLLERLAGRIEWAKAIKVAAKAGIALQIPSIDDIVDLVKPKATAEDQGSRSLDDFRSEFEALTTSDDLKHVRAVVVLVDDLDRCLPRTVVESLEAVRLFLAVPKMSFVIAADEERVADAIRTEFPSDNSAQTVDVEEPAKLYLHKIVQTTIPLPALSRFDTQSYLLLLQLQMRVPPEDLGVVVEQCRNLRRSGKSLDELPDEYSTEYVDEISFASRLTPLLYEKATRQPATH